MSGSEKNFLEQICLGEEACFFHGLSNVLGSEKKTEVQEVAAHYLSDEKLRAQF